MTIIELTPPLVEPLTLVEIRAHLRLDTEDEDALLLALATVAREHLERETGLVLAARATASFPGAFPPLKLAEIDALETRIRARARNGSRKLASAQHQASSASAIAGSEASDMSLTG